MGAVPAGPQGDPGPNDVVGNLTLEDSTADAGNVYKGGILFLHNFGSNNTFLGENAGNLSMISGGNTAVGSSALGSNLTGIGNTALGTNVLGVNTTGFENIALGSGTLSNATGNHNTAVGNVALNNTTGNHNTALGYQAGMNLTSGDNNIYLGNTGQPIESGTIRIGEPGVHTQTFLHGNVGIGLSGSSGPGSALQVVGSILATGSIIPSDARLKTNTTPLTHVLEKLEQLRGVSFEWNDASTPLTGHTQGQRDIGVIAQEVEAVFPELVTTWENDGYKAVAYDKLTGVLIAAVKEIEGRNGHPAAAHRRPGGPPGHPGADRWDGSEPGPAWWWPNVV